MNNKKLYLLFARYISLLILATANLFIFYYVFQPLTFQAVLLFLKSFYAENLVRFSTQDTFFLLETMKGRFYTASIIPACVAGAAYYLLTILNLTTPMKISKRIWSFVFLFCAFFLVNTLRISYFIVLIIDDSFNFFDTAHVATWYFGSTIFVIILWFANVLIFRIKTIPVYTDLKRLFLAAKRKHKF
jgi:exosortase/archaeosortase family protein